MLRARAEGLIWDKGTKANQARLIVAWAALTDIHGEGANISELQKNEMMLLTAALNDDDVIALALTRGYTYQGGVWEKFDPFMYRS